MINAELERLAVLAEECGEVVQVIGKIIRHGYDSKHPDNMNGPDNRRLLEKEIGDVKAILRLMLDAGDVSMLPIKASRDEKYARLATYMHNARNVQLAKDAGAVGRVPIEQLTRELLDR